ncbi:MAG: Unknown protein [uncultured Sulfurovum sp.]|uniref:Uncharacterized protein n=1 Tax=uncultured Sulfurovum sp. TaxID=269237 RepID=A0A6S6T6F0_9BACT|nr:MAG: Unknown protein [uncultured Sulfurovum sp.]
MIYEEIKEELSSVLMNSRSIEYQGVVLHLLSDTEMEKVLALELTVHANDIEKGLEKKNHFYDYAKIINSEFSAFKYTLSMKHKKKEIFDPFKVRKALPAEYEIWKNKSRVQLEKEIKDEKNAITDDQAKILREQLEKDIELAKYNVDKVLDNYENYDVVISTFEDYTYYPALYYVMEEKGKNKASDTHLRQDVPNLLWYEDNRPYAELRSNDRMSRIIQTFDRFCGSIYIKAK